MDEYKEFILLQNKLCDIRLKTCKNAVSDDFTSRSAISEFKNGKSRDQNGFIREIFTRVINHSILLTMNCIKRHEVCPLDWICLRIKTLKKNEGSVKYLNNYRGIFTVNILSLIFEKLVKKRIVPPLLSDWRHSR